MTWPDDNGEKKRKQRGGAQGQEKEKEDKNKGEKEKGEINEVVMIVVGKKQILSLRVPSLLPSSPSFVPFHRCILPLLQTTYPVGHGAWEDVSVWDECVWSSFVHGYPFCVAQPPPSLSRDPRCLCGGDDEL